MTAERLSQEIRSLWGITTEYSIAIHANAQQECPVTIPQLRGQQLTGVVIEHPNRDLKRVAIEAALCVRICKDWGLYDNSSWVVSSKSLENAIKIVNNPTLRIEYEKATGILEKVPREFERDQATHIRRLQEEWFRDP
jgi:hypothetical protein